MSIMESMNIGSNALKAHGLRLNASMLASTRMIKVVDDMYNKAINIRE